MEHRIKYFSLYDLKSDVSLGIFSGLNKRQVMNEFAEHKGFEDYMELRVAYYGHREKFNGVYEVSFIEVTAGIENELRGYVEEFNKTYGMNIQVQTFGNSLRVDLQNFESLNREFAKNIFIDLCTNSSFNIHRELLDRKLEIEIEDCSTLYVDVCQETIDLIRIYPFAKNVEYISAKDNIYSFINDTFEIPFGFDPKFE